MNKVEYESLIAFHPGYYVGEYIEELGITQEEMAKRLQTTPKYISDLVNGRINLTEEMALKLSIVFGTSVKLWLNLNQNYIEKKLEIQKKKQIDEECELVRKMDYSFWADQGIVRSTRSSSQKVEELRKYFRVSSLKVLQERDFLVQYRTGVAHVSDINVINANAWVQTAINIGSMTETEPYNRQNMIKALNDIRNMTVQKPEYFCTELSRIFGSCGVALVLLPNLKNCGVNGAVKWLGKDKAILALNDRRKYSDTFWFALFHEIGHVLQHRIKVLLVSENNTDDLKLENRQSLLINREDVAANNCAPSISGSSSHLVIEEQRHEVKNDNLIVKLEQEADTFSKNTLIDNKAYEKFLNENKHGYTRKSIIEFANQINILPGIIVGRLQQDGYLMYKTPLNKLKTKYVFEKEISG